MVWTAVRDRRNVSREMAAAIYEKGEGCDAIAIAEIIFC
jgi:hypothetical protein